MHARAAETRLLLRVSAVVIATWATSPALAGGGPENVLLLVNANSESSKTIANHYIALRKIPADNVLYLDWNGSLESGTADNFRDNILVPALTALDERKLLPQIDYFVYSSDFPWRFDIRPAFPDDKFPAPFDAWASITGVTYLQSFVLAKHRGIVSPKSNWYVPGPRDVNEGRCAQLANVPSRGFRSRYMWDPEGNRAATKSETPRYMLSTMLGVTQGRGNTVDEVIAYLRRSVAADGTRPQGTIYFMWNKDIRSATRDKCFETVAAQINAIPGSVRAKVQQGVLPDGAKDIAGLMVGAPDFNLQKSGIVIRPGAICEHLTSSGGIFNIKDQTPLSEFLRHGAAGASGAISEPFAIQAKFPLPSLQLHYARGCSLAEAFYQSISGPYQILIVGDPLCQPWATPPKLTVQGIKAGETLKGTVSITAVGFAASRALGAIELFIDGKRIASQASGKTFEIDTTKYPDGFHELRLVGIDSSPIETQGRLIVPFNVANHDANLQLKVSPAQVKFIEKLRLAVRQPGAKFITIRQNSRDLARVEGEAGEVEIAAAKMGRGPSVLQAFSEGTVKAVSAPVRVLVE